MPPFHLDRLTLQGAVADDLSPDAHLAIAIVQRLVRDLRLPRYRQRALAECPGALAAYLARMSPTAAAVCRRHIQSALAETGGSRA